MFGDAPKYSGWKPGENGDGGKPGSTKKMSEMSYSELTEYMAKTLTQSWNNPNNTIISRKEVLNYA